MTMFKKTLLSTALIAGLGLAAGTANAVYVNQDGLGQAMLYPYYTVNKDSNGSQQYTIFSVVNTTTKTKAVKVRFLESKNSQEVLDFNLFLSPNDMWVGTVIPRPNGGAGIKTTDTSCVYIPLGDVTKEGGFAGQDEVKNKANVTVLKNYLGQEFRNYQYLGDGGGDGMDRSKEGYLEILEMGDVNEDTPEGRELAATILHSQTVGDNTGKPVCSGGILDKADESPKNGTAKKYFTTGTGGLSGHGTIMSVDSGVSYGYEATALDGWQVSGNLFSSAGSLQPGLSSGNNATLVSVFNRGIADNYTFTDPAQGVSATLMHDRVINEYVLDNVFLGQTDWVVNFPTKRDLVKNASQAARAPFQSQWNGGKSCDSITLQAYDREEYTPGQVKDFSPPKPGTPGLSLCYEANVLTFDGKNLLGSPNSVSVSSGANQNGWLNMGFAHTAGATDGIHNLTSVEGYTFYGLPVVGFAVQRQTNGLIMVKDKDGKDVTVLSTYGAAYSHKYTRKIVYTGGKK